MTDLSHKAAVHIMDWLHIAEDELVGATVQTFNCEAGMCKGIRLDDDHGLCFTIDDPPENNQMTRRWYPVSTIRSMS